MTISDMARRANGLLRLGLYCGSLPPLILTSRVLGLVFNRGVMLRRETFSLGGNR